MRSEFIPQVTPLGFSGDVQEYAHGYGLHTLVHSTNNHKLKNGKWSGGGGFLVIHQEDTHHTCTLPEVEFFGLKYGGAAVPADVSSTELLRPDLPTTWEDTKSTLTAHGVTGWKRARPGNPTANLGQFVAELREFNRLFPGFDKSILRGPLKTLPLRALASLASFRKLGSGYLNFEFGWKPFVKDLQEMYKLSHDIDRQIATLRRNNGRNIKRERKLKDSTEVSETKDITNGAFGYLRPTPILGLTTGTSTRTVTVTTRERIWFEGCFRYWVQNIGSMQWENRARRALFGANPTPSLLWEVLPWSWLVDWFSNTGDVLSNMSENAVDGTVAKYAHVMRHLETKTVTEVSTTWAARTTGPTSTRFDGGSASCRRIVRTESKARAVATPYGFGVTYDGLSVRQTAILAALGVTRGSFR